MHNPETNISMSAVLGRHGLWTAPKQTALPIWAKMALVFYQLVRKPPLNIHYKHQVNMTNKSVRYFWIFLDTINVLTLLYTHLENILSSYVTKSFCLFLSVFLQFWYFFSCSANPKCFIAFVEERAIQKEQRQETYNQTQTRDRNP